MPERNVLKWNIMFGQICSKWRNIFCERLRKYFAWKSYLGKLTGGNDLGEDIYLESNYLGSNYPSDNHPGANCPGDNSSGGQLSGGAIILEPKRINSLYGYKRKLSFHDLNCENWGWPNEIGFFVFWLIASKLLEI